MKGYDKGAGVTKEVSQCSVSRYSSLYPFLFLSRSFSLIFRYISVSHASLPHFHHLFSSIISLSPFPSRFFIFCTNRLFPLISISVHIQYCYPSLSLSFPHVFFLIASPSSFLPDILIFPVCLPPFSFYPSFSSNLFPFNLTFFSLFAIS